ncbi:MAG: OsmC family protein [Candidatus Margulisiibacteriota bacterium]|nr:OsmC family protein [Candidatus Margulisiibacteriota bacterium]
MKKDMEIVFPGGRKVNALYKGFTIQTDQAIYAGGEGSAPAPFDLFLASLGTCAGIYVLRFCQERNIPSGKIKLILNTERDKKSRMIGKIKIEIQLPSGFPVKYKEAVVKAAELCAVTKHLYNPPVFDVRAKIKG